MKKKLTLIMLFIASILFISIFLKSTDKKYVDSKNSISILREKHSDYLKNSPFKKTLQLSKKERKALGIPPNKYYEREWELTMNPATGKPEPYKVLNFQKNRNQKNKSLAARNPGDAVSNSWEERGPNNVGGRTRVILFDPNDISNKRVFAGGVSGGLWVNNDITDSNSSWALVPDVPSNMNISCITVDPNDPNKNTWYLGTGEQYTAGAAVGNGVYKTINGGVTWTHVNVNLAGGGNVGTDFAGLYYINDIIAWNNGGSTEVFIGVGTNLYGDASPDNWLGFQNAGLYRTTDDGSTWSRIESSNFELASWPSYYIIPNDFEVSSDNNTLWMGTIRTPGTGSGGGKIFSSTNGTTWTEAGASPLLNSNRVELAVSSTDPLKMYALTQGTTGAGPHIYATINAFSSVTELEKPDDADTGIPSADFTRGQDFYNLVIEVDPTNDDIVYVGGIDLFRTTEGINTDLTSEWKQISKWSNNNNLGLLNCSYVHADQHSFSFRPNSNNEAVIGCDGGVFYASSLSTAENNNVISERNNNYNVTQFYYGGYGQSTSTELILAGAQDNGSQFINGAISGENSSTLVSTGDGAYSTIDKDGDYMIVSYVYSDHTYIKLPYTGALGDEYVIDNTDNEGDFINPAALDHNLNIMYSNGSNKINRYILGSSSSTKDQLSDGLLAGNPTAFKVSPFTTASTTLLVGTDDGKLLKLTNANSINTNQVVWEDITGGSFVGSVSSVEFGETENDIFVTFHNYGVTSIWSTLDGGTNWTNKEGDLPDMPIKCILQNPLVPNEVIVGTELGVWATSNFNDVSPNWISSFNGMRDVKVVDLDLRISDNKILATTFGRGVFTGYFSSEEFTITTENTTVTSCSNTAVFNFEFNTSPEYNTATTFSTSGEPAGVGINFNPASLSASGTFSLTIDNINSLAVGEYPITVIGTGNQTNSIDVVLKVDDNSIGIVNTLTPLNEAADIEYIGTNFTWDPDPEATSYDFDLSSDAGFNTMIETINTTANSYTITSILNLTTVYYWRIRSKNECITGDYSETNKFQTKPLACNTIFNNSPLAIPDGIAANTAGSPAESIINFPTSVSISDVNLTIDITHTYIGDLVISLIAPDNTEITLFNRNCNDIRYQNINVTYNDDGLTTINCENSAVSEIVKPSSPLDSFNGLNSFGDWTLKVLDYYNVDSGTINNWSLEICETQPILNSTFDKADPIIVSANSAQVIQQTEMEALIGGSPNEQLYMLSQLPSKGNLKLNSSILSLGDSFTQANINAGLLSYENSITINDTDQFKVDITNSSNGFLPNQLVNLSINATALSVDEQFFTKTGTTIFPTISTGRFNILSNTNLGNTFVGVYTINGEKIYGNYINFTSGNIEPIVLINVASGMYIVKLSSENLQGSKKIIIK